MLWWGDDDERSLSLVPYQEESVISVISQHTLLSLLLLPLMTFRVRYESDVS